MNSSKLLGIRLKPHCPKCEDANNLGHSPCPNFVNGKLQYVEGDEMVEKARDRFDGVAVRIYKDGCFYGKSAEVPKWAEWIREQARLAVRDALDEVSKMYRERYYCTEYSDTSDDFLCAVSALRKKFEVDSSEGGRVKP